MPDVPVINNKSKGIFGFKKQNKSNYTQQQYSMYGGVVDNITPKRKNDMTNFVVNQLGKDVYNLMVNNEVAASD